MPDGNWCFEQEVLQKVVVDFFKDLYTEDRVGSCTVSISGSFPSMDDTFREGLARGVTYQEVHDALFDMAPLKAHGIDGLHGQFFQSQWHIVRDSLVDMVQKGFETGEIDEYSNKTLIVLIPKVFGPEEVSQF